MFSQWDIAVMLARDVEADAAAGRVDPGRVARLARTVVEFQQGLLGRRGKARKEQPAVASSAGSVRTR
jgi:hypothetical protein